MTEVGKRRILGLATGTALVMAGVIEIGVDRSNYEGAGVQALCRAGLCADQFSVERAFNISQKATLGNAPGELEDFKRAIRLSPASAYRWADLGEAEFNVRDDTRARYALSQALKHGPRSPVILVRAANLEFEMGDEEQVVRHLKAVLSDPDLWQYYDTAFLTFSRLGLPIDQILRDGVPQTTAVISQLLEFWTKIGKADEAVATWTWADQRSLANGESMSYFFSFLIRSGRQVLAQQLWQEYGRRREPGYRLTNWIYNPSFENAPTASPFDWKIDIRQDVEVERVRGEAPDGGWSLRIRFSGDNNTDYQQTYQYAVLKAGTYKFSALLKSKGVSSDQGIRIHLFDYPTQAHLNVWTDNVVGDQGWTRVEKTFEIPAEVKLVQIQIARSPSMSFDNKAGGTNWLCNLQLTKN